MITLQHEVRSSTRGGGGVRQTAGATTTAGLSARSASEYFLTTTFFLNKHTIYTLTHTHTRTHTHTHKRGGSCVTENVNAQYTVEGRTHKQKKMHHGMTKKCDITHTVCVNRAAE